MNITKDILPLIDHITLALENCEDYEIKCEDILDIWFDEIKAGSAKSNNDISHDGRLVISKNAFKALSSFAYNKYADGTTALDHAPEEHYYFYNRITMCCDICQVHIYFKNCKNVWFFVDYDPLVSELSGSEIEYSNCPSAELNENGDLVILFGKSSHAFQRVDDDYYNFIEGLTEFLPKELKETLVVKIDEIGNEGNFCWSPTDGMYIEMRIQNRKCRNKHLPLQFFNVSELHFDFDFLNLSKEELYISTTISGKLFVQIGNKCNFYCEKIKVFEGF